MSAKEHEILDKISKLPEPLQDKFLAMANGATMAMDALNAATKAITEPRAE